MSTDRRPLDITWGGQAGSSRSQYDERMVTPMRRELTDIGFVELRTAEEVDAALRDQAGRAMVLVNSVCGCSARMARPAARLVMNHPERPERLYTVFAGQDVEATERARSYFTGYPPSSPSFAMLRDGKLVWMLERRQIEGRAADDIARDLAAAFERYA
jgi:putative YphP/YqiW family bacilliredoxin